MRAIGLVRPCITCVRASSAAAVHGRLRCRLRSGGVLSDLGNRIGEYIIEARWTAAKWIPCFDCCDARQARPVRMHNSSWTRPCGAAGREVLRLCNRRLAGSLRSRYHHLQLRLDEHFKMWQERYGTRCHPAYRRIGVKTAARPERRETLVPRRQQSGWPKATTQHAEQIRCTLVEFADMTLTRACS